MPELPARLSAYERLSPHSVASHSSQLGPMLPKPLGVQRHGASGAPAPLLSKRLRGPPRRQDAKVLRLVRDWVGAPVPSPKVLLTVGRRPRWWANS
jgi:hypothetical protein